MTCIESYKRQSDIGNLVIMICSSCHKQDESVKKFTICECTGLCYDCFLIKYIIYNAPPCKVIKVCANCNTVMRVERRNFLFLFTLDYYSSEFCYFWFIFAILFLYFVLVCVWPFECPVLPMTDICLCDKTATREQIIRNNNLCKCCNKLF